MRRSILTLVIALLTITLCYSHDDEAVSFPENFLFGTSSAAYQIEGAWNESGKGENIWDYFLHTDPDRVPDRSNGDIAADSYHLYERDVEILKFLNCNAHRFSLSWSRLLPNGDVSEINYSAITHYRNWINALKKANIRPIVSLYHWDLPQALQESLGGWENPELAKHFESYARFAFQNFGDLVSDWVSFNEPEKFCIGYASTLVAPGVNHTGDGIYKCAYTLLISHSNAYHVYYNEFCNETTNCNFGIVLNLDWPEPKNISSEADQNATNVYLDFHYNLYAKPIYSEDGGFPEIVRERAGNRLSDFTEEEKQKLIGSADFIGLNQYTAFLVTPGESGPDPSLDRDAGVLTEINTGWTNTNASAFFFVPWGMRKSLNYIHKTYPDVKILITENGYAGDDAMHDTERIRYLLAYLREAIKTSVQSNITLLGYLHWTMIDDFEWSWFGYQVKFGLSNVNFSDPHRTRTLRDSAYVYSNIGEFKIVPHISSIDLTTTYERKSF